MWNEKRSLMLSKFSTLFLGLLVALVLFTAPGLVRWLMHYSINAHEMYFPFFLASLYTGGFAALLLLYSLYKLLAAIGNGQVFNQKNVFYLRRISWCCVAGSVVALLSTLYYLPWLVAAIVAAFAALIVRVVKNVFAQAIALKEENDYTI